MGDNYGKAGTGLQSKAEKWHELPVLGFVVQEIHV